jgi:CBS domain-containing protein
MFCREVMTETPVCCLPNDLASAPARVMRREGVGAVPVINDEQRKQLIGIVTDRDLAIKVVAESRDPNHTMVQDVMTSTIVVCREREELSSAISVPVVDDDGRIVEIVSHADLEVRLHEPRHTAEMLEEISQAA